VFRGATTGANIASVLVVDTDAVNGLYFGFLDQVKTFLSGFLWTVTGIAGDVVLGEAVLYWSAVRLVIATARPPGAMLPSTTRSKVMAMLIKYMAEECVSSMWGGVGEMNPRAGRKLVDICVIREILVHEPFPYRRN
jgi:hypothetical protein